MNNQLSFTLRGRNPDVLTCIANLSNDEVFTPPEFANRMLNTLAEAWAAANNGANIWADSSVRFLDPFTKSGAFLREITSLLTKGLATEIPDLQQRVDHILTRQVFGIGMTHLTSLLARRSVYCSKHANGAHSIAKGLANETGNIWFERMEHTWVEGRCRFCGASQKTLDRGEDLETHAYAFIHTDNIKTRLVDLFGGGMQFDVIIGTGMSPATHQAQKLNTCEKCRIACTAEKMLPNPRNQGRWLAQILCASRSYCLECPIQAAPFAAWVGKHGRSPFFNRTPSRRPS